MVEIEVVGVRLGKKVEGYDDWDRVGGGWVDLVGRVNPVWCEGENRGRVRATGVS